MRMYKKCSLQHTIMTQNKNPYEKENAGFLLSVIDLGFGRYSLSKYMRPNIRVTNAYDLRRQTWH